MNTRTLVGRLFVSRFVLNAMSILVLALVVAITLDEIAYVLFNLQFDSRTEAKQETIGILLILFGVFLEGREVLARKVFRVEEFDHLPYQNVMNHVCEYYGFLLLVIGLGIELINQACVWIDALHRLVLIVQASIGLPLNIWAIILLAITVAKLTTITRRAKAKSQRRVSHIARTAPATMNSRREASATA